MWEIEARVGFIIKVGPQGKTNLCYSVFADIG